LGAPGFAATLGELLAPAAARSAPSFDDWRGADAPDFAGAANVFPLRAVDLDAIGPV